MCISRSLLCFLSFSACSEMSLLCRAEEQSECFGSPVTLSCPCDLVTHRRDSFWAGFRYSKCELWTSQPCGTWCVLETPSHSLPPPGFLSGCLARVHCMPSLHSALRLLWSGPGGGWLLISGQPEVEARKRNWGQKCTLPGPAPLSTSPQHRNHQLIRG